MLQFEESKVSDEVLNEISVESDTDKLKVTGAVGAVFNETVNVVFEPSANTVLT